MQFPAFTLEGNYMVIKHSIKIERHNFPQEWKMPESYHERLGGYQQGKGGGGGNHPLFSPAAPAGLTSLWIQPDLSKQPTQPYNHPKI
jgi:hypothetical protein